ncbi:hypothetical protein, partial [Escherichia coli]|uniref:hypothetical protein n=1 Tax=Escherichia coli TaxID=562 RepID=UPI002281EC06
MSHYSVNASVPKTLITHLVRWVAESGRLGETGAAVLGYDEIRPIDYFREYQPYPDTAYYTMCRDGKWGLMRSDGTEVLPCRASEPLFECSWNAHHWHGYL